MMANVVIEDINPQQVALAELFESVIRHSLALGMPANEVAGLMVSKLMGFVAAGNDGDLSAAVKFLRNAADGFESHIAQQEAAQAVKQ